MEEKRCLTLNTTNVRRERERARRRRKEDLCHFVSAARRLPGLLPVATHAWRRQRKKVCLTHEGHLARRKAFTSSMTRASGPVEGVAVWHYGRS